MANYGARYSLHAEALSSFTQVPIFRLSADSHLKCENGDIEEALLGE